MLRLSVSLALVLGTATLAGEFVPPSVVVAADDAADPVADWDKKWAKTLVDAAKQYETIVNRYEAKLQATAAYTRRRILRYQPDDAETRKQLGYLKEPLNDGTDGFKWVVYDVIHAQVRDYSDLSDPKSTKFSADLIAANKKVASMFRTLAKLAAANGALKDAKPEAKWAEKAARAWDRVLEIDDTPGNKDAEEAHKELKHPKFEGKLVSPFKLQFLKARADRKKSGEKTHATLPKVTATEPEGQFVAAGLTGGAAGSEHTRICTTHGKEVAVRLAQSAEQALIDFCQTYGFPEQVKERHGLARLLVVKDQDEFRKLLTKGAGWKDAEVQKYLDAHLSGTGTRKDNEFVSTRSAGADADDGAMSIFTVQAVNAAQNAAKADVGSSSGAGVEDWLWQSVAYDVTKRVNGTALTIYGAFGRYGDAIEARPGEDKWVELARRLVETDDDVALARLPKLKIEEKDFKGPETVKGWAFIQFVFEKDPETAKKFMWHALAEGTALAVAAIYPDSEGTPDPVKSMEKLDAEYREWILKGW